MNKIKVWYKTRPKWARKLMQATGCILAVCTAPLWVPALVVLWAILSVLVGLIEWWDKP